MDEMLVALLRKGAHRRPVRLTTGELGELAGISQQSASRRLAQLQSGGLVERGREGVRLTKKAYGELASLYSALKGAFGEGGLEIHGTVVEGLGEGGYYMSLGGYRRQIREKLGFEPFAGTLNIRVAEPERWKRHSLLEGEPVVIGGFRDRERTYGDLYAYRCKIGGMEGAAIFPLRTTHGTDIIEIIAPQNLRKAMHLKSGGRVSMTF